MANPYTVQLLNDLHHHFPEVLYNHSRFHTVSELLTYVNDVVRTTPQHQAYHYYNQQYHSRFDSYQLYSDHNPLYVSQIRRRSDSAEAMSAAIGRQLYGGQAYAGQAYVGQAYAGQAYVGQTYGSRAAAVPPPPPSINEPAVGASNPVVGAGGAGASNAVASNPVASNAVASNASGAGAMGAGARGDIRIRQFISFGNLDIEGMINEMLQEALPENMEDLFQNVPIIPTQEQLRNNTSVTRLSEDHPDNCAICQDPMSMNQDIRTLHHCQHIFHLDCIDTWFGRNIHCPCCRHDIREP